MSASATTQGRKKVDPRVRALIERGVAARHRSFFVLVGDRGRDQVANLHHLMSRATPGEARASVLWMYKKELGFSSHQRRRVKKNQKGGNANSASGPRANDALGLFLASTDMTFSVRCGERR